jgi:hypothetical protein
MAVEFVIQASNPRALRACDSGDQSLSDAIQTIFPLDTEWAFLAWNQVFVPLGYKYDVSMMVEDIILLLEQMLSDEQGARTIHWPSNTFSAVWDVAWKDDAMTVSAKWDCVVGGVEPLLSSRPSVSVPKAEFLAEWKSLLATTERAISSAGYTGDQIPDLIRLRNVIGKLPGHGALY